jgi:hypothetical protein
VWKVDRAKYHANKVKGYWNSLMARTVVNSLQQYFTDAMDFSAFEMESMIQVLHSYGDILSQIVNAVFEGSNLEDEDRVSLKRTVGRVPENIALGSALKGFYESIPYSYVSAFCNVIKHRKLIDFDFGTQMDFVERQGLHGFRFKDFTYRGKSFPETWFDDISDHYRDDLYEGVRAVGRELNNFLR